LKKDVWLTLFPHSWHVDAGLLPYSRPQSLTAFPLQYSLSTFGAV